MAKRSSTKSDDVNTIAARIVSETTEDDDAEDLRAVLDTAMREGKNPAAVLLGRKGGKKGGKARAAKLSKQRRSEIAKKAATARWQSRPRQDSGSSD